MIGGGIVYVGKKPVGQLVLSEGPAIMKMAFESSSPEVVVGDGLSYIREASKKLAAKAPNPPVQCDGEMDAATTIAAGILCELKEMGAVADGHPDKPRTVYASMDDMTAFLSLLWTVYAPAITVPACYMMTRAEIAYAVRLGMGDDPVPVNWEDDGS